MDDTALFFVIDAVLLVVMTASLIYLTVFYILRPASQKPRFTIIERLNIGGVLSPLMALGGMYDLGTGVASLASATTQVGIWTSGAMAVAVFATRERLAVVYRVIGLGVSLVFAIKGIPVPVLVCVCIVVFFGWTKSKEYQHE